MPSFFGILIHITLWSLHLSPLFLLQPRKTISSWRDKNAGQGMVFTLHILVLCSSATSIHYFGDLWRRISQLILPKSYYRSHTYYPCRGPRVLPDRDASQAASPRYCGISSKIAFAVPPCMATVIQGQGTSPPPPPQLSQVPIALVTLLNGRNPEVHCDPVFSPVRSYN